MEDEAGFLLAIADSPEDDAHRLVYADWLEERGDPKAAYLRVEFRVRVEGKQETKRLVELRGQLHRNWLRAVHDGLLGSDWAVVLQRVGKEREKAIAAIRAFLSLAESAAAATIQRCPSELKRGLRYWEAHRLRKQFGDEALVTVEFRP